MNIKNFLMGGVAGALMLGVLAAPAFATDGKGHNFLGAKTGISGAVHLPNFTSSHADPLAQPGILYDYTCDSVSRTAYGFGWKDTQTCTVTGATLPSKAYSSGSIVFNPTWTNHPDGSPLEINTVYGGCSDNPYPTNLNPTIWYSDWTYMNSGGSTYEVAQSFSYKLGTDGKINITSFYPLVSIQDPCF